VASSRNTIELFAHVENAHGILRDAIQQAVVGIFGSFDPSLKGEVLFQSFSTKLEQSLKLRDEIWKLLARMRSFEREPQPARVNRLVQSVMAFREESLRLLMFKDWELYYHTGRGIDCRAVASRAPPGPFINSQHFWKRCSVRSVCAQFAEPSV